MAAPAQLNYLTHWRHSGFLSELCSDLWWNVPVLFSLKVLNKSKGNLSVFFTQTGLLYILMCFIPCLKLSSKVVCCHAHQRKWRWVLRDMAEINSTIILTIFFWFMNMYHSITDVCKSTYEIIRLMFCQTRLFTCMIQEPFTPYVLQQCVK